MPGVRTTNAPSCNHDAGNDSDNPTGTGCSVVDLCAPSWHVCGSAADVAASSPDGTCDGVTVDGDPSLFFATRQSGPGGGSCGDNGTDDVFGCGNLGALPNANSCSPLNRFSHDFCSQLAAPWTCAGSNGANEVDLVSKPGADAGGVLCCKTAN